MECSKILGTVFLGLIVLTLSEASSPPIARRQPKYTTYKGIWLDNIQNQNPNVPLEHQTKSDAMQLYSIRSKQIVKVKETQEKSWEQPKYELTMTPKTKGRRDNKFVTETVSYQRLKIRSADNQKYLCARTNGEIVFKETADKQNNEDEDGNRAHPARKADKKNKPRKRCLFHWEFTRQMHIQLSLEAGDKKRYYLSVRDNVIRLREKQDTTELERSFIWLPTKSLKGQVRVSSPFSNGRSRKFGDEPLFGKRTKDVLMEKDQKIEKLKKKVADLQDQVQKIKGLEKRMEAATRS